MRTAKAIIEKMNGPFTFATYLLGIRTTLDLSQVELAKKLGITKAALCEIEKGRTPVSPVTAVKYAKKAGFSIVVALESCFQDQLKKKPISKSGSELKILRRDIDLPLKAK